MAARTKDPGWRDRAAAELLLSYTPRLKLEGPILVIGESLGDVVNGLMAQGHEVMSWNRRAIRGEPATPWPPPGPFPTITMRLPRSKSELAMTLAATAGALVPGGILLVYGAKDEGVGSAPGLMDELFHGVVTVGVGGRCRILMGERRESLPELPASLDGWREVHPVEYPGLPTQWISYPGIFAHGHLDAGTRLLLDSLPTLERGAKVLDYGCGSGIVGAVALHRMPEVSVHFLDVDSVALKAARENVPQGTFLLEDGFGGVEGGGFDAILTNPPFHRGKAEDPGMIRDLIRKAPGILSRTGRLIIVAQKRLHLEAALRRAFGELSLRAEDSGFQVWEGLEPIRGQNG